MKVRINVITCCNQETGEYKFFDAKNSDSRIPTDWKNFGEAYLFGATEEDEFIRKKKMDEMEDRIIEQVEEVVKDRIYCDLSNFVMTKMKKELKGFINKEIMKKIPRPQKRNLFSFLK